MKAASLHKHYQECVIGYMMFSEKFWRDNLGYLSVSNVNGEQLVVHGAFKGELERIIKKCWNASSQASKEEVLKTLAKDSYLVFDDKLASIAAKRNELLKKSKVLFDKLLEDFKNNSVTLHGHNGGTDKIDASKLVRQVLLRRIAPNKLLLQVERHPYKGASFVVNQFWLYNATDKSCELIGNETITKPLFGGTLVQVQGNWQPVTTKRDAFHALIKTLLGECGLETFLRKTAFQPDLLLDPSQVIRQECEGRIGQPIEEPRPTTVRSSNSSNAGNVLGLNMTKGFVVHGFPADFFLYKLKEVLETTCGSSTVALNKDGATVRVSGGTVKKEATFSLDKFELEIKSGNLSEKAELRVVPGRPCFETEWELSFKVNGSDYILSDLVAYINEKS